MGPAAIKRRAEALRWPDRRATHLTLAAILHGVRRHGA